MLERFTQWVRHMLGKPEDQSSNTQNSSIFGYGRFVYNSRWERQTEDTLEAHRTASLAICISDHQQQQKDPVSKKVEDES